jgi:hypothetical protein
MKITKKNNKRIDHVQKGLKADEKINPNRPLNEFTELVNLIGDQFDDDNTFTIKQEQLCLNRI